MEKIIILKEAGGMMAMSVAVKEGRHCRLEGGMTNKPVRTATEKPALLRSKSVVFYFAPEPPFLGHGVRDKGLRPELVANVGSQFDQQCLFDLLGSAMHNVLDNRSCRDLSGDVGNAQSGRRHHAVHIF